MKNKTYWEKRYEEEVELMLLKEDRKVRKELGRMYGRTAKRIILEMKELYQDIIEDKGKGEVHINDFYRYDRYYKMLSSVNAQLTQLGFQEVKVIEERLVDMYFESAALVDAHLPGGLSMTEVDEKTALETVNSIWLNDGKLWSDRIWSSKDKLAARLEEGLVNTVAAGRSPRKLADVVKEQFGVTFHESERIVRTELCHVQTDSTLDRYIKAGVKQYDVLDAGDWPGSGAEPERECMACHKVAKEGPYNIEDAKTGVNLPPLHPNCRCAIAPVIESL